MVAGGNDGRKEKPGGAAMRSLKGAINDLERLDEKVDKVRWKLFRLEKLLDKRKGSAQWPPPAGATPKGPAPTVQDLRWEDAGHGRAVVTFDNAKQVTLSPGLKALIAILAADEGASPDDLVAWKSFDRLAELLEKRLGHEFSHHARSQLLWRLRESLAAAGLERGLIETDPGLGARLRLKRRSPAALCAG
jgi:hypothetical protein